MPTLNDLLFLTGFWKGQGTALYPTINNTAYTEELTIEYDTSKPGLFYIQRTKFADQVKSANTLHLESGFIKQTDGGNIELSNSQNNGRVEVLTLTELTEDNGVKKAVFVSMLFGNDPRMISTVREFIVEKDSLRYEMKMATSENNDISTHLKAELKRAS